MQRISIYHIQAAVNRLNKLTGQPMEPYTLDDKGMLRANIGNYHISEQYGGVQICQMCNQDGGTSTPMSSMYAPKRDCLNMLHAYIAGVSSPRAGLR